MLQHLFFALVFYKKGNVKSGVTVVNNSKSFMVGGRGEPNQTLNPGEAKEPQSRYSIKTIEEGLIQKRRQRSSLLFGGQT